MNNEPQNPAEPNSAESNAAHPHPAPSNPAPSNPAPQGGHDVPLTPPPAPSVASDAPAYHPTPAYHATPAPQPEPSRSSSGSGARAGAIAIAAFGGIALLGAGGTAAFAAVHDVAASAAPGVTDDVQSVNASGIDALDVDVAASDVTVQFGDVDEATLEVTGTADNRKWRLERDEDELVLSNDRNAFGWLDGDWFGDWFDNEETVVLTLPESLNDARLDADFSLSAGRLDIEGLFGEVDIDMGAGGLSMKGSATSVETDISAGRAQLDLSGVTEAALFLAAGDLEAKFTDTTPDLVTIDVSAGTLDLTVPDEVYNVSEDVSAGSVDNRVNQSDSSRNKIDVTVSAGSVILRAGD
ncbi:MAG TPA: hypothetical protein DIW46_04865 [Microbacterium sp.]|nr:hypothetical protein [Microbacterium sp.]